MTKEQAEQGGRTVNKLASEVNVALELATPRES
jgi:hypothetical protein